MNLWYGEYTKQVLCPVLLTKLSKSRKDFRDPFYWHGLTLIPAWISIYIYYKMWDEIYHPFLNFNGATVEV